MLIWINFDSSAKKSSLLQNFLFPIEFVLNSLQTQKKPGTSFQVTVFV